MVTGLHRPDRWLAVEEEYKRKKEGNIMARLQRSLSQTVGWLLPNCLQCETLNITNVWS